MFEHGATTTTTACPACGSTDVLLELRDVHVRPDGTMPPRTSYGPWNVCGSCGEQWPAAVGHTIVSTFGMHG